MASAAARREGLKRRCYAIAAVISQTGVLHDCYRESRNADGSKAGGSREVFLEFKIEATVTTSALG